MKKKTRPQLMFRLLPKLAVAVAATVAFALSGNSAKAQFSQAPPTGSNTGAEFLISWDGTTFSVSGPSGEGPYDGVEDTLFGVQNNSSAPLFSIALSGTNIFGFDGDGIDAFNGTGAPPGSPGPTGYEGWTSTSSTWGPAGNTTADAVFFTISTLDSGTVNFSGAGVVPGGSAYFALEEHITSLNCTGSGCSVGGVPDTGSTLAYLGIACAVGLGLKRRLSIAR
jgi:hypothetical protein